jgi:hypothetical protein
MRPLQLMKKSDLQIARHEGSTVILRSHRQPVNRSELAPELPHEHSDQCSVFLQGALDRTHCPSGLQSLLDDIGRGEDRVYSAFDLFEQPA